MGRKSNESYVDYVRPSYDDIKNRLIDDKFTEWEKCGNVMGYAVEKRYINLDITIPGLRWEVLRQYRMRVDSEYIITLSLSDLAEYITAMENLKKAMKKVKYCLAKVTVVKIDE